MKNFFFITSGNVAVHRLGTRTTMVSGLLEMIKQLRFEEFHRLSVNHSYNFAGLDIDART